MNPPFVDTRPPAPQAVKLDDSRSPSKTNESQRRAFEELLSEDEKEGDVWAAGGASVDAGVRALSFLAKDVAGRASMEEATAAPLVRSGLTAVAAAAAGIPVPAPIFPPAPVQQASLYPHLALPHAQSFEMGRFEVLGGSLVSGVVVEIGTPGGMMVTVGTSVQHASLLDRYLPQLQRRLSAKATAHVRVQERDQRRD